jgi:undecaprenyl-diphosphatase
MGMALWLTLLFHGRILAGTMFAWAALNCYSRIRLGVHFPGDILAGSLVGMLLTYLMWRLYFVVRRWVMGTAVVTNIRQDYEREPWAIIYAVWGAMAILTLLALCFSWVNPLL